MKNLLTGIVMLVTLTITANTRAQDVLGSFQVGASGKTTRVYSTSEIKTLLESDKVACVSFNRKAYISKGYKAKFGNSKDFCNAKDAKNYGITRLDKNNLPIEMRK